MSTSVFVIVPRGPDILLLRRHGTGWKDGWLSLPAGAHDGHEPLAQAAARELFEETGLIAALDDLRFAHLLHCQAGDSGSEWLGAFFVAERWQGEPQRREQGKHDWLGWCPADALPEQVIPYTAQALRAVRDGRPYSEFGWPA